MNIEDLSRRIAEFNLIANNQVNSNIMNYNLQREKEVLNKREQLIIVIKTYYPKVNHNILLANLGSQKKEGVTDRELIKQILEAANGVIFSNKNSVN